MQIIADCRVLTMLSVLAILAILAIVAILVIVAMLAILSILLPMSSWWHDLSVDCQIMSPWQLWHLYCAHQSRTYSLTLLWESSVGELLVSESPAIESTLSRHFCVSFHSLLATYLRGEAVWRYKLQTVWHDKCSKWQRAATQLQRNKWGLDSDNNNNNNIAHVAEIIISRAQADNWRPLKCWTTIVVVGVCQDCHCNVDSQLESLEHWRERERVTSLGSVLLPVVGCQSLVASC